MLLNCAQRNQNLQRECYNIRITILNKELVGVEILLFIYNEILNLICYTSTYLPTIHVFWFSTG